MTISKQKAISLERDRVRRLRMGLPPKGVRPQEASAPAPVALSPQNQQKRKRKDPINAAREAQKERDRQERVRVERRDRQRQKGLVLRSSPQAIERQQQRQERDETYRALLAASTPAKTPRKRPRPSLSGEVTITRPDGTTSTLPALTPAQLRRVAPDRPLISQNLRARVFIRDQGTCRYCGCVDGPFEIDHVIPVAHGGVTAFHNLVTACRPCNSRKGIAHWKPHPLIK